MVRISDIHPPEGRIPGFAQSKGDTNPFELHVYFDEDCKYPLTYYALTNFYDYILGPASGINSSPIKEKYSTVILPHTKTNTPDSPVGDDKGCSLRQVANNDWVYGAWRGPGDTDIGWLRNPFARYNLGEGDFFDVYKRSIQQVGGFEYVHSLRIIQPRCMANSAVVDQYKYEVDDWGQYSIVGSLGPADKEGKLWMDRKYAYVRPRVVPNDYVELPPYTLYLRNGDPDNSPVTPKFDLLNLSVSLLGNDERLVGVARELSEEFRYDNLYLGDGPFAPGTIVPIYVKAKIPKGIKRNIYTPQMTFEYYKVIRP